MKDKHHWIVLKDERDFLEAINESAGQNLLVVDTEYTKTVQYGTQELLGISWGFPVGSVFKSYYAPFRHEYFPTYWNLPLHLLGEFNRFPRAGTQVYHNWPADHGVLLREGIDFSDRTIFDTMIAHHLIDENHFGGYSLDNLAHIRLKARKQSLTDLEKALDDQYGKNQGWPHIHPDNMGLYACRDVYLTYRLKVDAEASLIRQGLESLYDRYEKFIKVLFKVVDRGLAVDEPLALQLQDEARTEMKHLANKYEFLLTSPQKVADHLHGTLGVPVSYRTDKGAPSTSNVSLRRYASEHTQSRDFIQDVLRYRTLGKAVATWYEGFLEQRAPDGLLHPGLTIAGSVDRDAGKDDVSKGGTKTGRLSCRRPNLQQIPRNGRARGLLVDPPGYRLVKVDLSQGELRMIASDLETKFNDSRMAEAFRNESDLHSQTAEAMGLFKSMPHKDGRQVGKTCNFSLGYRAGVEQLQHILYRDANVDAPLSDVARWHRAWHDTYPGVRWLNEKAEEQARRKGYIPMWNGRRRHLRGNDCYKAFNSRIQGGVGQVMVEAMIQIDEERPDLQMVLQIHDELDFYLKEESVEEDVRYITGVLERIPTEQFGLPFVADWSYWHKRDDRLDQSFIGQHDPAVQ